MENCAASAVQMLACVATKNEPRCDGLANALCDCCATQVGRLRMPAPLLMKHKCVAVATIRQGSSRLPRPTITTA